MKLVLALIFLSSSVFATGFDEPLKIKPFKLKWYNHKTKGTFYKSADHPKAVFLIEAYFLNCPYCVRNAPNIHKIKAHFKNNKLVQVLDVSRDCRKSAYDGWISRTKPKHPVLDDCDEDVLGPLGVTGYPSTFALDCNLKVTKSTRGQFGASTTKAYIKHIEAQLKKGCKKK